MKAIIVRAPASKSMSHRALIASALSPGRSILSGVLESRDIARTMECLQACGASFEVRDKLVLVDGMPDGPRSRDGVPAQLKMDDSGTTCRLMTGVAASGKGVFAVSGSERMHERPIGHLAQALMSQGVGFAWGGREGYPPFVMETRGLPGGNIAISLEESSQYLSGLLLAAPLAQAPVRIELAGRKAVSWPYVSLTLQVMEDFGVTFRVLAREGDAWNETDFRKVSGAVPGEIAFEVEPGRYLSRDYAVEGDWSNASYFLAAGAAGERPVQVVGLRRDSLQGDRAMLDILARMGADVCWNGDAVTVSRPDKLSGVTIDMGHCPDLVPTICALAAQAEGPTTIVNVAHLRIKETDRLAAPARELEKAGTRCEVFEDGIRILPGPLPRGKALRFDSYRDHRMPMSLALFELAGATVEHEDPGCVDKSFPGFWDQWNAVREGQ